MAYESRDYWDARHSSREDLRARFEWFKRFEDLRPLLEPALDHVQSRLVIDLGCGLSSLIVDIARAWPLLKCVGVDFSKEAVRIMSALPDLPPNVSFAAADASKSLGVKNARASIVLDKSLMDTMLHDARHGEERVSAMLGLIATALVDNEGLWICCTQLDPRRKQDEEFLKTLVLPAFAKACPDAHWSLKAHVADDSPSLLALRKSARHPMLGKRRRLAPAHVSMTMCVYDESSDSDE